jgi:hypothetical protein
MGLSQIQHVACQHIHRDRPTTLMQPGRIGSAGRNPLVAYPITEGTRPRSLLQGLFVRAHRGTFMALRVLTLKSAVARDFHGGTKGLSDEMARRPVIGRIPVHSLVLDLV